jgi:NAD-dependent SIR2 family protein deacetylase
MNQFEKAAALIRQADGLIITAGAGMGVDSGLPDFRGDHGFWAAYPALGKAKMSFTDIACPQNFIDTPRLAWGFYGHRLNLYRETQPHLGFQTLQQWAQELEHGSFVYTSNVDGQFQKSGFAPERIVECHGSIHHLQTLSGSDEQIYSAAGFAPQIDEEAVLLTNELPFHPASGELMRPNILMFGDYQWLDSRSEKQRSNFQAWISQLRRPVIIELGAGTTLATIRRTSERLAANLPNAHLIRINPTDSQVPDSDRDLAISTGALTGLQSINAALAL